MSMPLISTIVRVHRIGRSVAVVNHHQLLSKGINRKSIFFDQVRNSFLLRPLLKNELHGNKCDSVDFMKYENVKSNKESYHEMNVNT